MREFLAFHDGGLFSTIQDLGRFGYQRFGISASGAMDPVSMRIANVLVGNPPSTAVIEITLTGPAFEVQADRCRVALAGAEFAMTIDGRLAECFRAHDLKRGEIVVIGAARNGLRGYLAVAGGFDIEPVLGSLSTHSRSALGGWEGRALRAGDRLPLARAAPVGPILLSPPRIRPNFEGPIRVLLGPQANAFTEAGIGTFSSSPYTVSRKTDRMGCHLDGPTIEHRAGFNIISDGIANGSIQVPGTGRPILLLADRQTTGGYPKIATIITPDLPKVAQRRPGDEIRFQCVDADEAERISVASQALLQDIITGISSHDRFLAEVTTERLLSQNLISGVASYY